VKRERLDALRRAVLYRIRERGDMHIRIRTRTLEVLVEACGVGGELITDDTHREVDAVALEALAIIAGRRP
jgi:dihydropteroate synthase